MTVSKTPAKPKRKLSGAAALGAGPGRPKGVPNKTTQLAKDAIAAAAEGLGGAARLIEWAKEDPANERVFWGQIYTKLLPLQVTGDGGGPIQVARIELVALGGKVE